MSKLTQTDSLTDRTHQMYNFVPKTETHDYSYTAGRVSVPVYNVYESNEFEHFGYYTDWSQYDGRLDGDFAKTSCGRGIDILQIDTKIYSKLIFSFLAIGGDKKQAAKVSAAQTALNAKDDEIVFLDPWGDLQSYRNVGFPGWKDGTPLDFFAQDKAQGLAGAFRELKKKNPKLKLSFCVGGWTLSSPFHELAKDAARRKTFVSSVLKYFQLFPMFDEVDIDWEYPNAEGEPGNVYGPEDGPNFASLIKELNAALVAIGRGDVKISAAVAGTVQKLSAIDVLELLKAGLWGFNVMTYDYFGTPWATELAHHTNLHPSGANNGWSAEAAVEYLVKAGIPSKQIFVGYAAYSRNAQNATISSVNPLRGTYRADGASTTGSYESGTTEWFDLLYDYADNNSDIKGKNGFELYSDETSEADFYYNKDSKFFLSVDTPRSVKAKGEFVRKNNLGGLFVWTAEQDRGLLANAACDGLGYNIVQKKLDMTPYYAKGKTSI